MQRNLRVIRIVLATLFFVAAVAYLAISPAVHPMTRISRDVQIIPSAITVTMGVTLVWLAITFIFGRVYCSSVCPVGTLQDIVTWICRRLRPKRKFRYQQARKVRYHILVVYVICLLAGVVAVPLWIEPWNIMGNICSAVNPDAARATWIELGIGTATGIAAGIVSALLIVICAAFTGRGFCNMVCPIGTALSIIEPHCLYHIEINPDKCTGCLKCEDVCPAQCIKVVSRYIDNSRCVRCFDCTGVCDDDAIRFQPNRNRPASPLMRKVKQRQP